MEKKILMQNILNYLRNEGYDEEHEQKANLIFAI
jgi:hypothetical protein